MEINHAISNYLDWKLVRSPRAAEVYKSHLKRFSEYKNKNTKELNDRDIVEYNQLLKIKYNSPTIAYSCRVLKNFFKYLNATQEASINTFLIQEPKYAPKQRIGVSDEEFKAMCATLNPWNLHDLQKLTILHLLYDTGIRVGELCDMNVDQITSDKNFTSIETKKNKQTRWIMWSKEFHDNTLIRWLGSRICLNQRPNLFLSLDKIGRERITARTVERWVKEIARNAGIHSRIHPHMFRHAKAHRMKSAGADLKDIQMMLGHITPYSALVYLNFDKNEMLANAQKYLIGTSGVIHTYATH